MSNGKRVALVLGLVAVVVAVLLAVAGIHTSGDITTTVDCGSALSPKTFDTSGLSVESVAAGVDTQSCKSAVNSRRLQAGGAGLVGVVLVIGAVLRPKARSAARPPRDVELNA
jgi:hypothetical protein